MTKGVIYILTNPSFPQYVKIGYADDLEKRMKQLNRSEAVPYAYRAYAVYEVGHRLTDKVLHDLIDQLNPDLRTIETFNGKTRTKEFFEMSPDDAFSILSAIARISGTEDKLHRLTPTGKEIKEEEQAEESRKPARRSRFKFSMVGIKPGDQVAYVNDPSKVVTIVDDSHVQYGEVTTSLSSLAEKWSGSSSLQGPLFFTYKGEKLVDMRERMETDSAE